MKKKDIALKAIELLKQEYPDAICSLEYRKPHELLIATRLAAQCTDARVNIVCKDLFAKYQTIEDFADAQLSDIENMIRSCGFYKIKAKDIINMCIMLRDVYGGVMPDTVEELVKLPGIGRKTANLMVGDIFGKPAIVVDTHCIRLVNRMGLVDQVKDPKKVEMALWKLIPAEEGSDFCHRLVYHGRDICTARTKPHCEKCCLADICAKAGVS